MDPDIMKTGTIFDLQEFSVHDGPGPRLTVFLKGCPLRCSWCHNPEGLLREPQVLRGPGWEREAGREWTSEELIGRIRQVADLLTQAGGGVTFSGGEVLMQTEFVMETIAGLTGVHIVADTSGYGEPERFRVLAEAVDLVFFGLKLADSELHRRYTGIDNVLIRNNLEIMKTLPTPFVARIPLIPGVTDTEANLNALSEWLRGSPNLVRVDLLPYNIAAGAKYAAAGMTFSPGFDESRRLEFNLQPFYSAGIAVGVV